MPSIVLLSLEVIVWNLFQTMEDVLFRDKSEF